MPLSHLGKIFRYIFFILGSNPRKTLLIFFSLGDMSMFARGHSFSKTVPYGLSQTAFFGKFIVKYFFKKQIFPNRHTIFLDMEIIQQLWRTALGHNFGEQRRGTALGSSFVEQLWTAFRPAGSFGQQQLWGAAFRSFGATGLENSFGHNILFCLWSSAGEQLWGAALGSSFEEQLCTAALKNRSFGEQLWGAAFGSRFGE